MSETSGIDTTPPSHGYPTIATIGLGTIEYATAAGFLLLLGVLSFPLWEMTAQEWFRTGNEAYTHAPLMPFIALYFIWDQRRDLAQLPVRFSWAGFAYLLLGALLFVAGKIGADRFTGQVAIATLLVGLVWTHFGDAITRRLVFSLSLLYLMIPIPSIIYRNLSFELQILSSKMSVGFMQLFALPVHREGNVIDLYYTQLEVAEACSGITSLVSLITVAYIFAYIARRNFWARAILVVSAIPIAMFTNAFRIGGTGMLAHYWSVKAAEGFFHSFAGWLVFIVAFAILLGENWLMGVLWSLGRRARQQG
jgi:exosortase